MAHLRIRTSLPINCSVDFNSEGFTPEFRNKLDESSDYFRNLLLLPLNDSISKLWAIVISPSEFLEYDYLVDVFLEDLNEANKVEVVFQSVMLGKKFHFFWKPFRELS